MATDRHPVAVLAALREEAQGLARHLARARIEGPGLQSWEGDLAGNPVVLILTGVGKVAAAMAAQFACDIYRPRGLLSIGLAGATDSESARGGLIVATGAVQHDMDARPLTDARGVVAGLGLSVFLADITLSDMLQRAAQSAAGRPRRVGTGLVLTGDQIVTSRAARDLITAAFPDGTCFDMETAAIAQVAHQNGVPWGGLRITSDSADESFDLDDVIAFGTHTAGELFERTIIGVLGEL
ncbi:MAG: 5'-methylthioadenosine/S-adenosylhomocysteine nucleosidase [Candidatus Dormiibacterota bacterium]